MTLRWIIGLLLASLSITVLSAEDGMKTLTLGNEFIKIIVNNTADGTGRFSVETVSGNPSIDTDDNQPLIFGRPIPWTSFTSIRIDNETFVFGGPSEKSRKRSKDGQDYGQVLHQDKTPSAIKTLTSFGAINVTQTLSLIRNDATNVKDTALITYDIVNTGKKPRKVGIRIMLDTLLGNNDGAPFRIGHEAIVTEQKLDQKQFQPFWQAFDNLTTPNVIAQGSLYNPQSGASAPDQLLLANWGSLAKHAWIVPYEQGRSFIREGELEKDTALGLYWFEKSLKPGEKRQIKTRYGLGGVSLAPGELSLGLTAPATLPTSTKHDVLIVAYIANAGGFDAKNTQIKLTLPEGLNLKSGNTTMTLPVLAAQDTVQIPLTVRVNRKTPGIGNLLLSVDSDTLEGNQIKRRIRFVAPPSVRMTLQLPEDPILDHSPYVNAALTLNNDSDIQIKNINVRLKPGPNLNIASFDQPGKKIPALDPGQSITFDWSLRRQKTSKKPYRLSATMTSSNSLDKSEKGQFSLFIPNPKSRLLVSRKTLTVGQPFFVQVIYDFVNPIQGDQLQLVYNDAKMTLLRLSPFVDGNGTIIPISTQLEDNEITVKGLNIQKSALQKATVKVHFLPIKAGHIDLILKRNTTIEQIVPLEIQNSAEIPVGLNGIM